MPYFLAYMSKKEFWICSIEISVVCCLVSYRRALLLGLGFLSRLFARHGRDKVGLTPNVNITERGDI
jgi:hypothetical protein